MQSVTMPPQRLAVRKKKVKWGEYKSSHQILNKNLVNVPLIGILKLYTSNMEKYYSIPRCFRDVEIYLDIDIVRNEWIIALKIIFKELTSQKHVRTVAFFILLNTTITSFRDKVDVPWSATQKCPSRKIFVCKDSRLA